MNQQDFSNSVCENSATVSNPGWWLALIMQITGQRFGSVWPTDHDISILSPSVWTDILVSVDHMME